MKKLLDKIFKRPQLVKNNKFFSEVIWNSRDYLMILIGFTEDSFLDVIHLQDAINSSLLETKVITDEINEVIYDDSTKEDNNKSNLNYILIGGYTSDWNYLYKNIDDISNNVLKQISYEISNNCRCNKFKDLINDRVMPSFDNKDNKLDGEFIVYDANVSSYIHNYHVSIKPSIVLNRLPNCFSGKDLIPFIKLEINYSDNESSANTSLEEELTFVPNNQEQFKHTPLYEICKELFNSPDILKIKELISFPKYKQIDDEDDDITGSIPNESIDSIFKEKYERFSALSDDKVNYMDIDEVLNTEEG